MTHGRFVFFTKPLKFARWQIETFDRFIVKLTYQTPIMNNKILIVIFAALLGIFALTKIFSGKGEGTFKPEIIQVDSSKVTKIVLHAKADSLAEVVLKKEDGGWTATKGPLTVKAADEAVGQFISGLALVKTNFIAAKSKDKWAAFEVGDDKASHVTVYGGDKVMADFYVGKFSVNQQARQITSYFRLAGSDNVYAVEGMGGMMLGQGFNAYRDKKVLDLDIHAIESLQYEGDQNYTVARSGDKWLLNGSEPLDSSKVFNFLANLRQMSGENFADGFNENGSGEKLIKSLTISGSNMPAPVVVRAWQDTALQMPFVVQSSQFPNSYFASDSTRLFKRIFKPVGEW